MEQLIDKAHRECPESKKEPLVRLKVCVHAHACTVRRGWGERVRQHKRKKGEKKKKKKKKKEKKKKPPERFELSTPGLQDQCSNH